MTHTNAILELQRQRMLLEIEYFTEKEAFRKLTESRGMARLVKRGDAWFPLRVGKSYYNSLNQLCIEVHRTADQDIEHNFEFGRPVQFFKQPSAQTPTTQTPTPNPSRGEGSLKSLPADNATYKTNQTSLPSGGVGGGYLGVWLSLAASLLLLFTLGSMWYGYERQNECVAYVYGERVTDRELVMHEMHTAMTSLAADDATATMEQQMKELFAE